MLRVSVISNSQPKSLSETNIAIMFALQLAASGQQVTGKLGVV